MKAIKCGDIRQGMIIAVSRFGKEVIIRADKIHHDADSVYHGTYVWEMKDHENARNQIYVGTDDYVFDVTPSKSADCEPALRHRTVWVVTYQQSAIDKSGYSYWADSKAREFATEAECRERVSELLDSQSKGWVRNIRIKQIRETVLSEEVIGHME